MLHELQRRAPRHSDPQQPTTAAHLGLGRKDQEQSWAQECVTLQPQLLAGPEQRSPLMLLAPGAAQCQCLGRSRARGCNPHEPRALQFLQAPGISWDSEGQLQSPSFCK